MIAIVLSWLSGIACFSQAGAPTLPTAVPAYLQKDLSVDQRVADLVDRMSMQQKAYQLDLLPASSLSSNAPSSMSATADLGAIAVSNSDEAKNVQKWLAGAPRGPLRIPPLVVLRAPDVAEGSDMPPVVIGATWDPSLAHQVAARLAALQRVQGINALVFPLFSFGSSAQQRLDSVGNAWLLSSLGEAFASGLQKQEPGRAVAAFPGYLPSGERLDPGARSMQLGERALRMDSLAPFAPLLAGENSSGVVVSAGMIDGVPSIADTTLLKKILREEWGFTGVTVADSGTIRSLAEEQHTASNAAVAMCQEVNAGIDLQWRDFDAESFGNAIAECMRNGVIPMDALNHAVARVLRIKFQLGLFDAQQPSETKTEDRSSTAPDLAARTAAESIILLRNENRLLPLAQKTKSIVVIESDSRRRDAATAPAGSVAAALKSLLPQAQIIAVGDQDQAAALASAKDANVAIVVLQGPLSTLADAAASDRLRAAQKSLLKATIAANPNTVVVFQQTDLALLPWAVQHAPVILVAWSPAPEAASAAAAVLAGVGNPAGRLPFAIAPSLNSEASLPASASGARPVLPLGFGLSYTTFRYSELKVHTPEPGSKQDLDVSVVVTNTGDREGDEVAQIYLHHELSSVETRDRALVGFQRVHLLAGQTRTLYFKIPQRQLAVWNVDRQWSVEPGPYTIFAGSSAEASLSATFKIGDPAWAQRAPVGIDRWVAAPTLEIKGTPAAEFSGAYQLALRVMEYNLHDGLLEAGKGYGTWTRDSSINAWNAASLLMPEVTRWTLWHQTELTPNGPEVGGQYWDKVIWIIAAYDYVQVTGDKEFLESAYGVAQRTLAEMRASELDVHSGLYRGPAAYGDGVAAYPDPPFNDEHGDNVLDYTEGANLETLSTNCVYYGAYRLAAAMGRQLGAPQEEIAALESEAVHLRSAIRSTLWLPGINRFAYFRDGSGAINPTQEALGEALAILLGVADPSQARAMIRHATLTPWGIPCTWQPYNRYLDPDKRVFGRHNGTIWPFINAFWATAAASTGESAAFAREFLDITNLAIRSADFREIYHPYTGAPYGGFQANKTWDSIQHQTWSATGYLRMVYRGIFGMRFEDRGLRLQPLVPQSLGIETAILRGLQYRDAELTLRVVGTGSRILRCTLDGVPQQDAFLPATLAGKHEMTIVLAAASPSRNRVRAAQSNAASPSRN